MGFDSLYLWLIGRAERCYDLEPLPRPIENPEQTFWARVEEGRKKQEEENRWKRAMTAVRKELESDKI